MFCETEATQHTGGSALRARDLEGGAWDVQGREKLWESVTVGAVGVSRSRRGVLSSAMHGRGPRLSGVISNLDGSERQDVIFRTVEEAVERTAIGVRHMSAAAAQLMDAAVNSGISIREHMRS